MTLLIGPRLRLNAIERGDYDSIARWYADMDFAQRYNADFARPYDSEHVARHFEQEKQNKNLFLFAVRLLNEPQIIGLTDLDVSWNHRNAWLGIGIGEPAHRNRGYGREAMQLTLDYAFYELNLHRVQLTVFEFNTNAIALYEKLGFVYEGAQREFLNRHGRRYDLLQYGLLIHEWETKRKDFTTDEIGD